MNLSAFQHSAFLQSLGWAIAHSVWQAATLWILFKIVVTSYSYASARFKNNLSTTLLFGSFLWFIITFFSRILYLRNYMPGSGDHLPYSTAGLVPESLSLGNVISPIVTTLPYLSVAYLLLLLFFAIKLINSYRNTNFIKQNGLSKPGAEWRLFVQKVANQIDITEKVSIWFSKHIDVPATIGFFKPVILIPLASLNQLTTDQMEAIILHEIYHIKRNDYLVNLFVTLIETILFFNPFVVLLTKIIKKERENCCDDFVLQYQYDRHSYASALLVLEQSRKQQFRLALTATSGKKQLFHRIKRIMEVTNRNTGLNYGQKLLALFLSTGIICSIAWLTPDKKAHQQPDKQVQDQTPDNVQFRSADRAKNAAIKYKDVKKATEPGKLAKEYRENTKSFDESTSDALKIEQNPITATVKPSPKREEILLKPGGFKKNNIRLDEDILKQINDVTHNVALLSNPFLADVKFPEVNFAIDLSELRTHLEKSEQAMSSMDWANIKEEINTRFEEIALPQFNMNFQTIGQNNSPRETTVKRLKKTANQLLTSTNEVKEQHLRISKETDSAVLYKKYDVESLLKYRRLGVTGANVSVKRKQSEGVSPPAYKKPVKTRNYTYQSYTLPPADVYGVCEVAAPPAKRKKTITVTVPAEGPQNIYSYQYSSTSPKGKVSKIASVYIDNEGVIIVNGKKLNLSKLENYQVKKIADKLIIKDSKQVIEIESFD